MIGLEDKKVGGPTGELVDGGVGGLVGDLGVTADDGGREGAAQGRGSHGHGGPAGDSDGRALQEHGFGFAVLAL